MLSIGHLIIDPISNIALQTLPAGSEWASMIEGMQLFFPLLIDICIVGIILLAIVNVVRSWTR